MSFHITASYADTEGKLQSSVDSLSAAEALVKRLSASASAKSRLSIEVKADAGKYPITESIVFDSEIDPGLAYTELSLVCDEGSAVFTGNLPLCAADFVKQGDAYVYRFEKDADGNYPRFRDFYVNGKRIPICRSEFFNHPFAHETENRRNTPANLEGIYIPKQVAERLPKEDLFPMELTIFVEWEYFTMRVLSIDMTRTREDDKGNTYVLARMVDDELRGFVLGLNPCLQPRNRETMLGNHPSLLTENTWCYNHETGILTYMPKKGESIADTLFEVPALENMLIFKKMDGISLRGLSFTGTTSKFLCDNGYLCGQANCEKRQGKLKHSAILTRSVRRFAMEGCRFEELGANGLIMLDSSIIVRIRDCVFKNIGMAALSIGNPSTMWEDPINRNIDVRVENNLFRHIGYEYPAAVAFYISMVDGLSLCHNTFVETAYSAISIGWGWSLVPYALGEKVNVRDADIAYNKIIDYMQVLRDGAAIYVVGANCRKEDTHQFNFMHDNYAERELFDSSKRGYYLDGSSSNWAVYDSVTTGTPHPVFSQFHVPSQFTWHNRIDRIYTTEEVPMGNHHPERDTLVGEWYLEPTIEELLAKYPKAQAIKDAAGCTIEE